MKLAAVVFAVGLASLAGVVAGERQTGPYARQVADRIAELRADSPPVRARAAEGLGFLRAYAAEEPLIKSLKDASALVRRQAVMALAWCGGRRAVAPLLLALDDDDWLVRQAAHVSLTNITGMEFPFDALAVNKDMLDKLREDEQKLVETNQNPISFEWLIRNNMQDCQRSLSIYDKIWFGKFVYLDRHLNKKFQWVTGPRYKGQK